MTFAKLCLYFICWGRIKKARCLCFSDTSLIFSIAFLTLVQFWKVISFFHCQTDYSYNHVSAMILDKLGKYFWHLDDATICLIDFSVDWVFTIFVPSQFLADQWQACLFGYLPQLELYSFRGIPWQKKKKKIHLEFLSWLNRKRSFQTLLFVWSS